jgi:imidazolonepropionase-like amidohydrolase
MSLSGHTKRGFPNVPGISTVLVGPPGRDTVAAMAQQSTPLRFRGPVLPDGEPRDLYVVAGKVTYEPQTGAESVAEGWIVPGLVDAHCHVGLDENGAVDEATTEQQALTDRDAGALLLRDCGSAADTAWVHERADLPRLVRAGRHIARTKRYIRNYAHEVEPDELASYAAQEAQRGDGWIKLVGDWIDRDTGDLEPSFPPEAFAAAIRAAHEHGAKVTAHCFGEAVLPGLIAAGIDCIEHGTGLTTDLIEELVEQGTALVPTVMQLDSFPQYAEAAESKFPAYARHMLDLHERRRDTIMAAHEAGVAIYAGTDAGGVLPHGQVAGEVRELAAYGFSREAALGAASWHAREWLGLDGQLSEGTSADFVVYARNPLEDLGVLAEPARIVLRGVVVG